MSERQKQHQGRSADDESEIAGRDLANTDIAAEPQEQRESRPLVIDDTAGHPETLRAVFASLAPFPRTGLRVVFGLRGMRGADINRRLCAMLGARVAERARHEPVLLVVTSSDVMADARNRTLPEEREAAIAALEASGARYDFVPGQREAIHRLLDGVVDDELVLVLGPQGMDHASELVRELLGSRDAARGTVRA